MRKLNEAMVSLAGLLGLLAAGGCSDSGGGDDERGSSTVAPFGVQPSSTSSGASGLGGAPSTGLLPGVSSGGAPGGNEQLVNPVLPGAAGNSAVGTAGAAGAGQMVPQVPGGGYFESGAWHGYGWTESVGTGTTITPADFSTVMPRQPFCASGSVGPAADYGGVSIMGFNINQGAIPPEGTTEAPKLTAVPTGTGIAVNFTKAVASPLRIQIQGPNGSTEENDRWCFEIAEVAGPIFAPYTSFNTRCWVTPATASATNPPGVAYARQPLEAVSFTVPGSNVAPVPFDYCVSGFADGDSADDAAQFTSGGTQILTGSITEQFGRQKVQGADGKSYMVQNNAWGTSANDQTQSISYSGNSFSVVYQRGTGANNEPVTFPSLYVGANGFQGVNGSLTTRSDDNLPRRVGDIQSIMTTLRHNGGAGQFGNDYNATYDVWFFNQVPADEYGTATGAFLMVWTHRPPNRNPISTDGNATTPRATNVQVPGVQGTWELWVGPRREQGNFNTTVISYVVPPGTTLQNFTFDLNAFINDAVSRNLGLTDAMFLTDVFGGFEIWSGGQGLQLQEFSVNVQ